MNHFTFQHRRNVNTGMGVDLLVNISIWSILRLFFLISSVLCLEIFQYTANAAPQPRSYSAATLSAQVLEIELAFGERERISTDNRARGSGGIIAVDLDGNKRFDFLISQPGRISAISNEGNLLWHHEADIQITKTSETEGLPGLHAPGIQATDIDGDGELEVFFLTRSGHLNIVSGKSGFLIKSIYVSSPPGTERWEHLVIANFSGAGDLDILLQTTNSDGYRMGSHLGAYNIDDLLDGEPISPLWHRDDFVSAAHNGARVADLDGDGRDEVIGGSIISPEGNKLYELPLRGHIDAIQIADVRPDIDGLEVVAVEEGGGNPNIIPLPSNLIDKINWHLNNWWFGGNRVFVFNSQGMIWETHYKRREPQNVAVGDFLPAREGLEIWCRSRFSINQRPFVFDSRGNLITSYALKEKAPADWTSRGLEVISPIFWNGKHQLIAAKARHQSGDVALVEPLTGEFVARIPEKADRLYIADVCGDWREEIIVVSFNHLRVYTNIAPNLYGDKPRLWEQASYKRLKQTWNYYSP